jgi:hypothetical protein
MKTTKDSQDATQKLAAQRRPAAQQKKVSQHRRRKGKNQTNCMYQTTIHEEKSLFRFRRRHRCKAKSVMISTILNLVLSRLFRRLFRGGKSALVKYLDCY